MEANNYLSVDRGLLVAIFLGGSILFSTLACAQEGDNNMDDVKDDTLKKLPEPRAESEMSVEEAIERRRSVRSFASQELSEQQISQLLWAAQGITDDSRQYRAAPSAGATYPLEVHLATAEWVGHYQPEEHALEITVSEDVRRALARAALGQRFVAEAPAVIVVSAIPERTTRRYGERGIRYVYMEAGHAAQNVHLQAVSLGLGSVPVGAARDDQIREVLGLPDNSMPLYIIPVGDKE